MKAPTIVILFALMATTSPANAVDSICEAVALRATTETDDFSYPLKLGQLVDAITQYNVNKKTGVTSFCSHGGGCYPGEHCVSPTAWLIKASPLMRMMSRLLIVSTLSDRRFRRTFYGRTT